MPNKKSILPAVTAYVIGFLCLLLYFVTDNASYAISMWNVIKFTLLIAGIGIPVIVTILVIRNYLRDK